MQLTNRGLFLWITPSTKAGPPIEVRVRVLKTTVLKSIDDPKPFRLISGWWQIKLKLNIENRQPAKVWYENLITAYRWQAYLCTTFKCVFDTKESFHRLESMKIWHNISLKKTMLLKMSISLPWKGFCYLLPEFLTGSCSRCWNINRNWKNECRNTASDWDPLWDDFYWDWRELWFNRHIEPPSWPIGETVMAAGASGVLFHSNVLSGGTNLVLFPKAYSDSDSVDVYDLNHNLPKNQDSWIW